MAQRTDRQIINQTNDLAEKFYRLHGYQVPRRYRFDRAKHPQELAMWDMARIAQIELTDTDPDDAVKNLGE